MTGFKYASGISKSLYTNVQGKVNSYVKLKTKYFKKGVESCKSMPKLV